MIALAKRIRLKWHYVTSGTRSQKAILHGSASLCLGTLVLGTRLCSVQKPRAHREGQVGVLAENPDVTQLISSINCQTFEGRSIWEISSLSRYVTAVSWIPRAGTAQLRLVKPGIVRRNDNEQFLLFPASTFVVVCDAAIDNKANKESVHKIERLRSSREAKLQEA